MTKRMERALAEIRRQMVANEEKGDREMRSARSCEDEGKHSFAVRQFASAAGAYHMACAYAIALGEVHKGLQGEAAWPAMDELAAKQGRYARLAGDAEAGMDEPLDALRLYEPGPAVQAFIDAANRDTRPASE